MTRDNESFERLGRSTNYEAHLSAKEDHHNLTLLFPSAIHHRGDYIIIACITKNHSHEMADDQQQPQPDAAPEQPPKAPPMGKAPPKAKARAPRGPRVPKPKAAKAKPKAKQGPLLRQGEISLFI